MELSVEDTLEPRVAFLKQTVGVADENIGKVITRLPSVLTYTEEFMQERVDFLRTTGLTDVEMAKAVTAHPQASAPPFPSHPSPPTFSPLTTTARPGTCAVATSISFWTHHRKPGPPPGGALLLYYDRNII